MAITLDDNYNNETLLSDYYPIIQNNQKTIEDEINKHEAAEVLDHPDGCVTGEKIAAGAVTANKLADNVKELINTAQATADSAIPKSDIATYEDIENWTDGKVISMDNIDFALKKLENHRLTELLKVYGYSLSGGTLTISNTVSQGFYWIIPPIDCTSVVIPDVVYGTTSRGKSLTVEYGFKKGYFYVLWIATDAYSVDVAVPSAKIAEEAQTTAEAAVAMAEAAQAAADAEVTEVKLSDEVVKKLYYNLTDISDFRSEYKYSEEDAAYNLYVRNKPDYVPGGIYLFKPTQTVKKIVFLNAEDDTQYDELCGLVDYNDKFPAGCTFIIQIQDFDRFEGQESNAVLASFVEGYNVLDMESRIDSLDEMAIDYATAKKYSTTPQRVGTWIDGTPVWRVVVEHTLTDLDIADIQNGGTFGGVLPLVDYNKAFVINDCVFQCLPSGASLIDDIKCEYANGGNWKADYNAAISGGLTLIHGWVEFATPEENLTT